MDDAKREQLERFLSEGALKALFFSRWYQESWETLRFDRDARGILAAVMEESYAEDREAKATFREWETRLGPQEVERLEVLDEEMLQSARQGFLSALIVAKDASAVFFQKAALMAQDEDLADRFAQLAARDFDHGMRLRKMLVEMFYAENPMAPLPPERDG